MQMAQMDEEEGGTFPTTNPPGRSGRITKNTTIKGPGVSKGVSAYSGGMATQNYRRGPVIKPCFE